MQALLRERRVSVLAMLGATAAGPAAIVHFFGSQRVYIEETVHFVGIGFSAGFAALAAIALTREGRRRGDGRAVLVGTAF